MKAGDDLQLRVVTEQDFLHPLFLAAVSGGEFAHHGHFFNAGGGNGFSGFFYLFFIQGFDYPAAKISGPVDDKGVGKESHFPDIETGPESRPRLFDPLFPWR